MHTAITYLLGQRWKDRVSARRAPSSTITDWKSFLNCESSACPRQWAMSAVGTSSWAGKNPADVETLSDLELIRTTCHSWFSRDLGKGVKGAVFHSLSFMRLHVQRTHACSLHNSKGSYKWAQNMPRFFLRIFFSQHLYLLLEVGNLSSV